MPKSTKAIGVPPSMKGKTLVLLEQLRESGQPIVLSINGQAEVVVQDDGSYQRLWELVDRLETIAGIRRGLEDMKAGRGQPAKEALEEIRKKYNIPRDA